MRLLRVNRNIFAPSAQDASIFPLDAQDSFGQGGVMQELPTAGATVLAILMLAAFALAWGGVRLIRRGERQKGVLMIVCALVALGNVLIWTL
ncbi:hypothetical protein DAH55_07150 [Sphingomonas koreensis]|uniref:hypothetical protein n=1 Tax=Sphingomonas koreensis TaxID=93064 RepID=UPI000832E625|nr:hypothetical protein [Sphingomonas koreensis]PJI90426.1 hypothetical protein BDW16_3760 [Sphingomonas koreensis]RSU61112.1 hypothetical protein DAH56_06580 [Sphingomonas koreensis]RSU69757.1 hypothetical protein DAH55_07150 [Sphingomonas koreensis]